MLEAGADAVVAHAAQPTSSASTFSHAKLEERTGHHRSNRSGDHAMATMLALKSSSLSPRVTTSPNRARFTEIATNARTVATDGMNAS